jgi:hypothetical protein
LTVKKRLLLRNKQQPDLFSQQKSGETPVRKTGVLIVWAFVVILFTFSGRTVTVSSEAQVAGEGSQQTDPHKAYPALDRRFVTNDKGVVTVTKTGLEWFVGPDRDTTWDEAKAWTESLSVDGGGWRMPTRDEVKGLYTGGAGTRNMSPLLKTTGGFVWTGETVGSSHAWGFCLHIVDEYWPRRTRSREARGFAVRSRR